MSRFAHYTTDTHELAPFPNMTSDDLCDFERWTSKQDEKAKQTSKRFAVFLLISLFFFLIWLCAPANSCGDPDVIRQLQQQHIEQQQLQSGKFGRA